jgi:hypothetical protein
VTESKMSRGQAGLDITDLERLTGADLRRVPVHLKDQWAAGVRDAFRDLEAPLDRPEMARAAMAGAYVTASVLINSSPQQMEAVALVSQLLRWLYDRGEEAPWPVIG